MKLFINSNNNMKIIQKMLKVTAKQMLDFIDLTDEVKEEINRQGIKNGIISVFARHTTAAIRINENEKGFKKDFKKLILGLIPKDKYYCHNDLNIRTENIVCSAGATDCINGHSHIQHMFLGASETIPIVNGKMALGKWQRIFLIELDKPRIREVLLNIIGE